MLVFRPVFILTDVSNLNEITQFIGIYFRVKFANFRVKSNNGVYLKNEERNWLYTTR